MKQFGNSRWAVLLLAGLFLVIGQSAEAVPDNDQSWIILERDRPAETIERCLNQEDFLSRWVLAVAEVRLAKKPSANDQVSQASRTFDSGQFKLAAEQLQLILGSGPSAADQLPIHLFLGASQLELDRFTEAEALLALGIDQAKAEGRLACRCFGQLNRGRARIGLNQLEAAQKDLQATIKLSRRLETHRWAAQAALAMSYLSRLAENPDDILYWLEAALQYYRHGGHIQGQVRTMQLLGETLCELGECEEGLIYLEEANSLAQPEK